jgi:hypothetical protein
MAQGEGGGRPRKKIDPDQVRKLAAIGCSLDEMGSVLNCSADTLGRRFADAIKEGRDNGHMSLKRKQYEIAMSGNVTMLIWLGKIRLQQVEVKTIQQEYSIQSAQSLIDVAKDLADKI